MNANPLHQRALQLCRAHARVEFLIIEVLQKIDDVRLYKKMGYSSLFKYAVEALGLSEPVAYSFISVSRKAKSLMSLQEALKTQRVSVSKIQHMVSVLNPENVVGLIEFSQIHTSREIDLEVARINPKAYPKDQAKPLSENRIGLKNSISLKTYNKLQRVIALEAQRGHLASDFDETLDTLLEFYLERQDPVRKAERAMRRQAKQASEKLCLGKAEKPIQVSEAPNIPKRKPLSAQEKHAVLARDGGRCTHLDPKGQRCANDRWLAVHHIQHVNAGGTNDPQNLTTLCGFHHDLVHQLSLPLDGAVNWLRSPQLEYRID